MKRSINIFLADDHPLFREGLVKTIETESRFKVTGFADCGNDAIEFIRTKKPDIAILDISMPGHSGIEVAKIIKTEELPTVPIILTMYNDEEYLDEALENGVPGYLLKNSTATEVVDCINIVLNGGYFISKELREHLTGEKKGKKNIPDVIETLNKLTKTELHILKLLSENKTSTQIAKELFVSFRTIQNHRANISMKLGISGYNKLLFFALEHKKSLVGI
jgi:DNA-binding NarL/FixJ family response regulator